MRALTSGLLVFLSWTAIATAQPACVVDFVDFEVISLKSFGIFAEPHDFVIRNERQWCRFWRKAHAAFVEPPPCDRSAVDFQHEMVLASTSGPQPNACFGLRIAEITRVRGALGIQVFVDESTPGPSCVCAAVIVFPVQAVVVSKPVGPVEFVHQSTSRRCSP